MEYLNGIKVITCDMFFGRIRCKANSGPEFVLPFPLGKYVSLRGTLVFDLISPVFEGWGGQL